MSKQDEKRNTERVTEQGTERDTELGSEQGAGRNTGRVTGQGAEIKRPEAEYGSSRFIASWTILIILALLIAFLGRLLGYEDNPFHVHTLLLALFAGTASVIIIALGIYVYLKGKASKKTMTRRKGVMIALMGVFMLGGFFAFEMIVPMVFG